MLLPLLLGQGTAGPASLTATLAVTLDDITVASSGTVGHSASSAVTLDGITVASAATLGHTSTIAVTLDDILVASSTALGHPATLAVTLEDVTVAVSATQNANLSATLQVSLDDVVVASSSVLGHSLNLAVILEDITVQISANLGGFDGTYNAGVLYNSSELYGGAALPANSYERGIQYNAYKTYGGQDVIIVSGYHYHEPDPYEQLRFYDGTPITVDTGLYESGILYNASRVYGGSLTKLYFNPNWVLIGNVERFSGLYYEITAKTKLDLNTGAILEEVSNDTLLVL